LNNVLIGIGALLFAVLAALFAVPHFVDWNRYRGVFEEEASRLVGRDVRVGGAVNLRLLPTPYLSFEKIRIADTDTSSGEPFFRAESADIRVSIAPLARGIIEASEIELRRPVLRLALDAKGGGNWQSLGRSDAGLPFVPADVALQSVRIADGSIALVGADQVERFRLDALHGEFGAPSIEGPYRFRGTYGPKGQERELRMATSKTEPDGSIRFKGSQKRTDIGTSIVLDARLLDLAKLPRIEGELSAEVPLPRRRTANKVIEPPIELKAKVTADANVARLGDLSLSFENKGQPQILEGGAEVTWKDGLTVATSLSARWLDLDQLIGVGESQSPLLALIDFASDLNALATGVQRSATVVSVEQANLGREAVSGVSLSVKNVDGETRLEDLKIGLPGGSRADVSGRLVRTGEKTGFDGYASLRGASAARMFGWSSGGLMQVDPVHDGPFALRTRLKVEPGKLVAEDLFAEITGSAIQGDITYDWRSRRQLTAKLDGPRVDLKSALPGKFGLSTVVGWLTGGLAATDMDISVALRTGQFLLPGHTLRDVVADLELKDRALKIAKLGFATGNGVSMAVEGDVTNLPSTPKGELRGFVSVTEAAGFDTLWSLIDWPDDLKPSLRQQSALAPLQLAGTVALGRPGSNPIEMTADGVANGVRVRFSSRLAETFAHWRERATDTAMTLEASKPSSILNLVGMAPRAPDPQVSRSRLEIKAVGIPSKDLSTLATLEAGSTILSYRGSFASTADGPVFDGELSTRTTDGARIAQVLGGLLPRIGLEGLRVEGSARIASKRQTVTFDQMSLAVGPATLGGDLSITREGDRRTLKGRLNVSELTAGAFFAQVIAPALSATTQAIEIASGRLGPWPEQAFDFAALQTVAADIELTTDRLVLADGLALANARTQVFIDGPSLELRNLEATALGGRWTGLMKLSAGAQGATLTGLLRVTGGDLEAVLPAPADTGQAPPSGAFNAVMTVNGRGLSPRGLMSALSGSGSIDLGQSRFRHATAATVADLAEAALRGPSEAMQSSLRQRLLASRDSMTLTFGPRVLPFDINEGSARLRPVAIDLAHGRIFAEARVDLANLGFNGEWRIETPLPPPPGSSKPPVLLPPLTFVYSGPLAAFARITPRLDSERLEQELAVRKMERDVDELERLRKLDEERAKEEAAKRAQANPPGVSAGASLESPAGFGTLSVVPTIPANTLDAATTPTAVPDPPTSLPPPVLVGPPTPAQPPTKGASPAYRALTGEELKKIFGSGG
jgi:uncharacterized protein involved in outer membrane biogenesis